MNPIHTGLAILLPLMAISAWLTLRDGRKQRGEVSDSYAADGGGGGQDGEDGETWDCEGGDDSGGGDCGGGDGGGGD